MTIKNKYLNYAALLLGLLLLICAPPLAYIWEKKAPYNMVAINMALWIVAISGLTHFLYLKHHYFSQGKRFLLLTALFALSVFPFKSGEVKLGIQTLSVLGFVLSAYALLGARKFHRPLHKMGKAIHRFHAIPPAWFLAGSYSLFFLITLGLCWYCFTFVPGYNDSISQYIQGKFIAEGKWYGQTPVMPRFYPVSLMVNDGHWYAQYQPLHPILLGFGHAVGAPWIINPLCGAFTLVAIYALARRIADESTARLACALMFGCTFMLFMTAEFMNHAPSLLCVTLFVLCYVEILERLKKAIPTCAWAIGAGCSIGALFLLRPLTAIGISLPFAVHALWLIRSNIRLYIRPFAIIALLAFIAVGLNLWYNSIVTGNALIFPSGKYHRSSNLEAMGIKNNLSLEKMLSKAQSEWMRLNSVLFEWWLPSTFFILVLCLRPFKNIYIRLLVAMLISHTICNMANQFRNNVFGPRYLYELSSALIILTALGMIRFSRLLQIASKEKITRHTAIGISTVLILMLFALSFTLRFPVLLHGYTRFFDNNPSFYFSLLEQAQSPALVFVGEEDSPNKRYRWVAFTNPPADDAPVIFALNRGAEKNAMLMLRYPDRKAYIERKGMLEPLTEEIPSHE